MTTTKYRQRQQERLSLDKAYNAQRAQLDRDYADKSKGMSRETYEANSLALSEALAKDKAVLEQHYQTMDELKGRFSAGLASGLENWIDKATDVYSASQSLAENTFNGMSDALTDFVVTGKDSFGDFAESVLKDLTRMIIRMAMFKALEAGMSAFGFGSLIPGGGNNPGLVPMGLHSKGGLVGYSGGGWVYDERMPKTLSFAAGGYTGAGGKYEPKGIVHGGEYVFTKEATRRIGAERLDALANSRAYRRGGYVPALNLREEREALGLNSQPQQPTTVNHITVQAPNITIQGNPSDQTVALIQQAARKGTEDAVRSVVASMTEGKGPVHNALTLGYNTTRRKR